MGKYDAWDSFFANLEGTEHRFDLDLFEEQTGVDLPPSAREHAPWWSNAQYHAKWTKYGWRATSRLATNEVIFRRVPVAAEKATEQARIVPEESTFADLILLGCVASKQDQPAPAGEFYTSTLWWKRRRYAEASGKPWIILSAEYGVIEPDAVIAPYDRYMESQPRAYRNEWSKAAAEAVIERCRDLGAAAVEIHAGKAYIEFGLEQRLKDAGIEVVRPLRHLRRGEQLAWYDFAQRYDEPRTQTAPRPDRPASRPPSASPRVGPRPEGAVDRTVRAIESTSRALVRFVERFRKSTQQSETLPPPPPATSHQVSSEQRVAVVEALLVHGTRLTDRDLERGAPAFTPIAEANDLLLADPFAFLVGVVCDYQVKAERAWEIPHHLSQLLRKFSPEYVSTHGAAVERVFAGPPALHRFPTQTARWVVGAGRRVIDEYGSDAASIWSDNPTAELLQRRLREFDGISQKKAAMAVEILERQMGIAVADLHGSDIAYDVHVRRVFLRSGLAERDDPEHMLAEARRLYPERPGALDNPAWDIGRRWCRPTQPQCDSCAIGTVCPQLISQGNAVRGA